MFTWPQWFMVVLIASTFVQAWLRDGQPRTWSFKETMLDLTILNLILTLGGFWS